MDILLKSFFLSIIFWIFYQLFLRKNTFFNWNRVYLLFGLLSIFIIPFVKIPIEVEIPSGLTLANETAYQIKNQTAQAIAHDFIPKSIMGIYWVGIFLMFLNMLVQIFSLKKVIQNASIHRYGNITYRESSQPISAFSFFKFIIINDDTCTESEKNYLLVHESIHANQWHSIDILLSHFLVMLQWFNPFAWMIKKTIATNLEYIADRETQKIIGKEREYQEFLFKTSIPNMTYSLSNSFHTSFIKNRIKMLHTNPSKPIQKWKFFFVIPILALFIYSFNRVEIPIDQVENYNPVELTLIIESKTTDAELKGFKEIFKSQDINFETLNLKRNQEGDIIGIQIKLFSKFFNTQFESNSDQPIDPIAIKYDSNSKKAFIGNLPPNQKRVMKFESNGEPIHLNEEMSWEHKNEEQKIIVIKSDNDQRLENQIEVMTFDPLDSISKKEITLEWTNQNGASQNMEKKGEKRQLIFISDGSEEEGESTIYIVNGKEMSKEEMEKLKPEEIKEIQVIKKIVKIEK